MEEGQDNTMAKRKRTKNDLQNITQITKDRGTPTPIKTGGGRRCSGRVPVSFNVVLRFSLVQAIFISCIEVHRCFVISQLL